MSVEAIYRRNCERSWAMAPHYPRLRALARGLSLAVEFGVKHGGSSSALLMGADRLISYDIAETPEARELEAAANSRWDYRIQSSLEAEPVECDLLFIDSAHEYAQCRGELERHADSVRCLLVFHDTITFGSVGSFGETGQQSWDPAKNIGRSVPVEHLGIRPAIDELMIRDRSWQIEAHYTDAHGLLVLRRVGS